MGSTCSYNGMFPCMIGPLCWSFVKLIEFIYAEKKMSVLFVVKTIKLRHCIKKFIGCRDGKN